jgi:predicted dinucleotide-binding enzyme
VWCDVAVLCTKWAGTESAVLMAGPENLKGKIVIDATNPLKENALELAIGGTDSAGETVQRWLPESHVVKAWNTVNYRLMIDPVVEAGTPLTFICGNDAHSKGVVSAMLKQFGWRVDDTGDIKQSRVLEPLCIVYCRHAFASNDWNIVLGLVTK